MKTDFKKTVFQTGKFLSILRRTEGLCKGEERKFLGKMEIIRIFFVCWRDSWDEKFFELAMWKKIVFSFSFLWVP